MKVFVSGGTGVVGRRVLPMLTGRGHDVTALARSPEKAAEVRAAGATPVEVSLFDPEGLKSAIAGHDAVVNLATKIPPASKAARKKAWAENNRIRTEGVRNLVDASLSGGVLRFVQESVAFLYADGGDKWLDESSPLALTDLTTPSRTAEETALSFDGHAGTAVVLRFGMFYGPDSHHTVDMARYAKRGFGFLPGPRHGYVSSIHTDDAAAAVIAALESDAAGVFNVSDDEPVTREEYELVVARAVGRERLRPFPSVATLLMKGTLEHMLRSYRVHSAALRKATAWEPRYGTVREGLPAVLGAIEDAVSAA